MKQLMVTIYDWFGYKLPIKERYQLIKRAEFEIPTMVVHLHNEDNTYNALGLDRIKRITEKAEKLGVNVALENLRNFANLRYVLEQIDSRRIGFCYDCGYHYSRYPD